MVSPGKVFSVLLFLGAIKNIYKLGIYPGSTPSTSGAAKRGATYADGREIE